MAREEVNIAKGLGKGVEIVEELRNKKSADNLFAGIFNGSPPFDDVASISWLRPSAEEKQKRDKVIHDLVRFLIRKVDLYTIDNEASVPLEIFKGMAELGLYGMKVPEGLGGKGLSNSSYLDALGYAASWSSAIYIVLSAHNTIGCPFPVMYYGTEEQKAKFLPEFVKWPTAFCLTEEEAGSDAANIKTHAVRVREGNKIVGYRLFGQKWYTTNIILSDGVALARYLAVVARIVNHRDEIENEKDYRKFCYGLFIVPTESKGVDVGTRNTFIGMRGIHNSNPKFNDVHIPIFNLIGERREDWESDRGWGPREGSGLKVAFESLNTGRIAIAKGCLGVAKQALNISRWWSKKRSQLGGPLQNKELVQDKLVYGASNILAMEAMINYASNCFENGQDVRLEAAAAKVFCSERTWQIVDNMMQLRGGRGYETWQSLSRREITPPDDMIWLGSRPNRIFEGANEILVQFIFREGTDKYIKAGMPLMSKDSSIFEKARAVLNLVGYYVRSMQLWSSDKFKSHEIHEKFIQHRSGRLARKVITKSVRYRTELAVKQLTLDRLSRISINLGAMLLSLAYARRLNYARMFYDYSQLADVFCQATRKEVESLFSDLDSNDDDLRYKVSKELLNDKFDDLLLGGIIPITEYDMRGPKN